MTALRSSCYYTFLLLFTLFSTSCSATGASSEIILVGSTPGDDLIKSLLAIPPETKIDFIRWQLTFNPSSANRNSFFLKIVFGESKPNTLGFKDGGEVRTLEGIYLVAESKMIDRNVETYHLNSDKLPAGITLLKLNDNLFHLLTPQNQLMNGNGGWSYSLNRKDPILLTGQTSISYPSILTKEPSLQVVFDGRTPCREIAAEHPEMNASTSCFKLKWKLILNRDSINHKPTTYIIRKVVDNEPRDVTGRWTIITGIASNPDAVIYRLDPDKPDESISFLAGDDNVLFFLNKENEPFIGNEDFSFTLNRRIQ